MSTWKPGDVAMVTVDYGNGKGARDVICFRSPGWWRDSTNGNSYGSALREVKAARPLVVIDPEDAEQVERLYDGWLAETRKDMPHAGWNVKCLQAALREFANPTPPKCEASVSIDSGEGYVVHVCRRDKEHAGPHESAGATWWNEVRP